MSKYLDRYASAVTSSNMRSRTDTAMSDADVIGAAGLAAKHKPLAMALARMLSGDQRATHDVTRILATMAQDKADAEKVKMKRHQAADMARAVIAWFRNGICTECGGHGFQVVGGEIGTGRTVLSDAACPACRGTGKKPFDNQFGMEQLLVARWLLAEVEANIAAAGATAMAKLAPRLGL